MFLWLYIIPAAFGIIAIVTNSFFHKSLVTLSCALIMVAVHGWGVMAFAPWVFVGFMVSIVGDWFLSHPHRKHAFLCGIAAFLTAHICFIMHCVQQLSKAVPVYAYVAGGAVLALGCVYFFKRAWRAIPANLKPPALIYLFASCTSFFAALAVPGALGLTGILFIGGIACIVVSDICICEYEFVRNQRAKPYILPLYYMCHILLSIAITLAF